MKNPSLQSTLLSVIVGDEVMADRGFKRLGRLALEALLISGVALLITWPLRGAEGGAVALFLTSAGLASRFEALLAENRSLHTPDSRADAHDANRLTARSVLAIFLGIFAAFVVAGLLFGSDRVLRRYGFLLEIIAPKVSIISQRFGPPLPLLRHNGLVLASAVILGLVYRSFGVRIVLIWNAASWGLVLPLLVLRALASGAHHPALLIAASLVAVLPHLVLEALSYVTAGLSAVFASMLLTRDDVGGAPGPDLKACARMLVISVALLVTAAMLESYWTPLVLDLFPDA